MVAVLLAPGDLIVLAGSARHGWTHEISRERAKEQVWAGKVLEQARRISVTLRRLCPKENVHYMES
jgi:alkylated DNA repair dioxygenase AlkB